MLIIGQFLGYSVKSLIITVIYGSCSIERIINVSCLIIECLRIIHGCRIGVRFAQIFGFAQSIEFISELCNLLLNECSKLLSLPSFLLSALQFQFGPFALLFCSFESQSRLLDLAGGRSIGHQLFILQRKVIDLTLKLIKHPEHDHDQVLRISASSFKISLTLKSAY
ncbi:hypothetical protein SAMN05428944_2769 [Streptomyces sp. 1222.5]|nr:hypothetical protein BX260_5323 [Streptomyces sp. 5112.2]SEC16877.1 hypothetical protein SAMN05428944_2769 [Streptomyces sp. 1222.5]